MAKKINAKKYDTDKSESFINNYERYFGSLADKRIKLLEIGVFKGGSLYMWHEYFEKGVIIGLDINPWINEKKWIESFSIKESKKM